jgi:hypothetical protein
MSLAPINTGQIGSGQLKLQPGWKFSIDDFNMDVLTFSTVGGLLDTLISAPDKYSSLANFLYPKGPIQFPNFPPAANSAIGGLSCSDRTIAPSEALLAQADFEFKGFMSGTPRKAISQLTWLVGSYSATVVDATVTFTGPTQAQLTLKQGNTGAYNCMIGQVGDPPGSSTIPNLIVLDLNFNNSPLTLTIYAFSPHMLCIKHDRTEAGVYGEETQVWVKNYVRL